MSYPSLTDSPPGRLKTSNAFNHGLFANINDRVLVEMNKRAKEYLSSQASSTPMAAAQAAVAVSRGIKSPRSARKTHHKRFSSIHRRDFEKLPSIATHFSVVKEEKNPNSNGKREGVIESGSPMKKRRMESVEMSKFTFPAKPMNSERQLRPTTMPTSQTFTVTRTQPISMTRAQPTPMIASHESPTRTSHRIPTTKSQHPNPPERTLRNIKSQRSLRPTLTQSQNKENADPLPSPTKIDNKNPKGIHRIIKPLNTNPEIDLTSKPERPASRMNKSPSSRSLAQSLSHSTSTRSLVPPPSVNSRIPRSTTLQSMRSTDNLRSYKTSFPSSTSTSTSNSTSNASIHHPSTPTSRLLKSRILAKSSPNLNALAKDTNSIRPSRPAWR